MSINEKFKAVNNKIQPNKVQYDLDRQIDKFSALSSRKVSKRGYLTGKDMLLGNELLEKAAAFKRFEYYLLAKN